MTDPIKAICHAAVLLSRPVPQIIVLLFCLRRLRVVEAVSTEPCAWLVVLATLVLRHSEEVGERPAKILTPPASESSYTSAQQGVERIDDFATRLASPLGN